MTTTPCVQCGEPLSPEVRFCPNCGTRQPEPSQAATQILPPSEQGESAVPPTILVGPPQQNAGTPPQTPPQGYGAPQTPPQGYGAPQQNAYGYNAPPQEPPAKKSRLPLIIGILVAVGLCLIVGVVGAIGTLAYIGQRAPDILSTAEASLPTVEATLSAGVIEETPESFDDLATATPVTDATSEAEPTAEALPTEESAPTEDLAATDEAVLQATDVAAQVEQATAIAQQEADNQAIQATTQALQTGSSIVFNDTFDNNRNNWFTGRFNDNETNILENGVFRVIRDSSGRSYELYQPRALTNFVAEVDCKVLDNKEGGCGLVYGQNDDQGRWDFDIYTDYYQLNIIEGENATRLLEGDPTGIVRPNDWNRVKIIRRDGITYFYINDVFLGTSDDTRFANGRVGVLTTSYQETGSVEIQFDNFVVSELK